MRRVAVVTTVTAAVLLLAAGPGSAETATPRVTPTVGGTGNHLVVLGDSWAAGTAAGVVDPTSGPCRRSPLAAASRVALALRQPSWVSRACATPGAGVDTARADDQFGVIDANTREVVATVGGDAVGLGTLARACSTAGTPAACDGAARHAERMLTALPRALDASLAGIRRRTPTGAIVLADYPLFADGSTCRSGAADIPRAARLDAVVTRLDDVLAARAAAAGARMVDVRRAFRGHGPCAADPWLTPLTDPDPVVAGAATATGQARGYAPALVTASAS